ncbi:MAG: HlyD family efflux transporter periplasmic adaptor subunit [Acidobacteria bacterium]|nr:HlyD family efflux transporter periplasmic adaptor subunit [Acidobacteriota bacterium]
MNQLSEYKTLQTPVITDQHKFTETFYGQLVTNLDEVFEEMFFSPLEQSSEKNSLATSQVTYDESTLRILFAEIAAIYIEPVKIFITNLKEKKASLEESQIACCALIDVSNAAKQLELFTLSNKISLLTNEIQQWSNSINTDIRFIKEQAILFIYDELVEIPPQAFTITEINSSNRVVTTAPITNSAVHVSVDLAPPTTSTAFYYYPPRLHQYVEIVEQIEKEQSVFWFKDTRSNRYFKAGKREREIILLIDGSRTVKEICETIKEQMNLNVKVAQLTKIMTKLDSIGLIDSADDTKSKNKSQKVYQDSLNIMDTKTFRLTNPDQFFTKLNNFLPWVFTKTFVISSLILMALVMLIVSNQYNEFYNQGYRIVKEYGFLFNYICFLIVVSLHEIGHGITCKHYGGRVTDVGVIVFGLVLPGAYCNISDIYLFKNKWHRVYALLAGLYTQFLIATIAAIGALIFTTQTIISDLCYIVFFSATASTVINLIPLIKLDGYYILTNLLDEYNLQTQAITYIGNISKWWLYGNEMPKQSLSKNQKLLYLVYGSLSLLLIRVLPILFIFFLVNNLLLGKISFFALIFAPLLISRFYKILLGYCFSFPKACYSIIKIALHKKTEFPLRLRALTMLLTATIFLGMLITKWPEAIVTECRFSFLPNKSIPITCPSSGVIDSILVKDQELIKKGQTIATIINYDNEIEISKLKSKSIELQYNRDILKEKINQQNKLVEQTLAYLQNYQEQVQEAIKQEQTFGQRQPQEGDGKINELYTNLESTKVLIDHYNTIVKKQETLLAKNLTPEITVEKAKLDYQVAIKKQQEAHAALALAITSYQRSTKQIITKKNVLENQLIAAKAKIDKLRAELKQLDETTENTNLEQELLLKQKQELKIKSPTDGIIIGENLAQSLQQPNNAGFLLCKVVDSSQLRIEIEIPEWQITKINVDKFIRLKIKGVNEKEFLVKVEAISNEAIVGANKQRVYLAYASLEDKTNLLKPGLPAIAYIEFSRARGINIILNKIKQFSDYPSWWPN